MNLGMYTDNHIFFFLLVLYQLDINIRPKRNIFAHGKIKTIKYPRNSNSLKETAKAATAVFVYAHSDAGSHADKRHL
jgi:hypothetical protein